MKRHQEDDSFTNTSFSTHLTHVYTLVLFLRGISMGFHRASNDRFPSASLARSDKANLSALLSSCRLAVVLCLLHQAVIPVPERTSRRL